MAEPKKQLRSIAAPFVAARPDRCGDTRPPQGPDGRGREGVAAGRCAPGCAGLARSQGPRARDGLEHSTDTWAARKRASDGRVVVAVGGSITKATHDQWALSRRGQPPTSRPGGRCPDDLRHRLSLPDRGEGHASGLRAGTASRQEWFAQDPASACAGGPSGRRSAPTARPDGCASCGAAGVCSTPVTT